MSNDEQCIIKSFVMREEENEIRVILEEHQLYL